MTEVCHLVIGPEKHGVVRHGLQIAAACEQPVIRAEIAAQVTELRGYDVVHVPFTDRLFAAAADAAQDQFLRIAELVRATGARLSITLHDLPHDESALQQRRRRLYDTVAATASGVVVNSGRELELVEDRLQPHSLRMIPLPVIAASQPTPPLTTQLPPDAVVVLGFVFPDRGYEDVIAALPEHAVLVALGTSAAGHDELIARYRALSRDRFRLTGFVPDSDLPGYLAAAPVPVAPNRRVTASASINTWLAHGRRPLVPDSAYTRELLAARPGTLTPYDPTDPADLRAKIAAALNDPSSTRLPDGHYVGPTLDEVAAQYRHHLDSCRPPRAIATPRGFVVPGNRWDLLPEPASVPSVSVVIPYYDGQSDLDLVLAALRAQTHPDPEIIVVDDGSPRPPRAAGARVLRQDDRGFRAAAARNLGARHAGGDVLVFLDGDTVPEPGFVEALAGRAGSGADVLAVGRRRHADLTGVSPGEAHRVGQLVARGEIPELPEPEWLSAAYAAGADLLHAERRSYRHVISAVLALRRDLFEDIGGFDERFVGYGGEDWEFAHRAWVAGAVLVHERAAVAWHNGPDWAARADPASRGRAKNAETAMLSALLPDPQARGAGPWWRYPSIVVTAAAMSDVDALATVRSAAAAGVDCAFWFDDVTGPWADLLLAGAGVGFGAPPQDVAARAWCRVRLHAPAELSGLAALAELAERVGTVRTPALTAHSARALTRSARHARALGGSAARDWLFGHADRTSPRPRPVEDLAADLAARQPRGQGASNRS